MDEFKFVFKTLVFACFVFALSQYRTNEGITIESRIHTYLISSNVADFVNESAHGAVKLIEKLNFEASNFIESKMQTKSGALKKVSAQKKEKQINTEDIDLD